MIESYSGTWSLCLKDLSSGRMITINDRPQSSASLIKLYIMGAVLETMDQENLIPYLYQTDLVRSDVEELRDLLYEMISVSDNDAANELVRYLDPERRHQEGMECVNSFIQRNGFSDTRQTNGLGDPELWYDPDTLNATSAKDCVSFLEQVYNGTMVSHLASRFMETLLMEQEIIYKIPYTLPKDSLTANKSGETDTTENDAAIVYSAGGDYILCIMSTDIDLEDKDQSVDQIRNLSEAVYSFFNPSADSIMYKIEHTVGYPEDETEESQTAVIGSIAYQDERIYEYHIRRKP
ncbi:MAG: serine hydrolase [Candidatus Limivivens sp.]|nr:serine hydrolase [Candidatus Limivivens sp.]